MMVNNIFWLVVEPYPSEKYENQLGGFFPIYGKRIQIYPNGPNHQAAILSLHSMDWFKGKFTGKPHI